MAEANYDLDNPISTDSRDVVIEEMKEKIKDLETLSLRPLVLLYESELRQFKAKLVFASPVPGELCKKKVELWDDEVQDLIKFLTELLNGANAK